MKLSDYTYTLPEDTIAKYPLPQRDKAKLLVYRGGAISHAVFDSLAAQLPSNAFLFFNDTRVIPARLHFQKQTGARIEVFLLNPVRPSTLLLETMQARQACVWQCTIGNLKKWSADTVLTKKIGTTVLTATLEDRETQRVAFQWDSDQTFAEIIERAGDTPLPPYLHRKAEPEDRQRYQTIYSHFDGAVAAPTAGLHFTTSVFNTLKEKGIGHDFVTLHVSAGTFLPVKTENPEQHPMHKEQIIVTRKNVDHLLNDAHFVTAVGTTSMRTLESLYWFGVRLLADPDAPFVVGQNDPYRPGIAVSKEEALHAIAACMNRRQTDTLIGETSIFIRPGYDFKLCRALITNFHQPMSTLIMLVAAFVGEDWRKIYEEALTRNYRFLSYGDSSLLIPEPTGP